MDQATLQVGLGLGIRVWGFILRKPLVKKQNQTRLPPRRVRPTSHPAPLSQSFSSAPREGKGSRRGGQIGRGRGFRALKPQGL